MTKIEWADLTINPVVGCSKCSPGCDNCYAERFAARMAKADEKLLREAVRDAKAAKNRLDMARRVNGHLIALVGILRRRIELLEAFPDRKPIAPGAIRIRKSFPAIEIPEDLREMGFSGCEEVGI